MKKITAGFVIQEFNDKGDCVRQEFVAGDDVSFEDNNGNPIDWEEDHYEILEKAYHPFDMVQPQKVNY